MLLYFTEEPLRRVHAIVFQAECQGKRMFEMGPEGTQPLTKASASAIAECTHYRHLSSTCTIQTPRTLRHRLAILHRRGS